mgnify:CR=1 FL=1
MGPGSFFAMQNLIAKPRKTINIFFSWPHRPPPSRPDLGTGPNFNFLPSLGKGKSGLNATTLQRNNKEKIHAKAQRRSDFYCCDSKH